MPYLNKERKATLQASSNLAEFLDNLERLELTAGDLNYIVTNICNVWLGETVSYERLNAIIGALESAKLEYYRRIVSPYEDKKIQTNGDVF